jgi:hypothetical protein
MTTEKQIAAEQTVSCASDQPKTGLAMLAESTNEANFSPENCSYLHHYKLFKEINPRGAIGFVSRLAPTPTCASFFVRVTIPKYPQKGSVGGVRAEASQPQTGFLPGTAAAVRTNEETWQGNQEKNIRLRSSRSKRAIIPSIRQFLFSRRSSLPSSMKP